MRMRTATGRMLAAPGRTPNAPAATWQEDRMTDAPDAHWETAPERYVHTTERYAVGALPRTGRSELAPGGGAYVVWRRGR